MFAIHNTGDNVVDMIVMGLSWGYHRIENYLLLHEFTMTKDSIG